jgi:hypothetical protein
MTLHGNGGETLSALCKATGRWGMFVDYSVKPGIGELDALEGHEDAAKAAPWVSGEYLPLLVSGDGLYVLFDSCEEMESVFRQTVGDDGPTEWNPYDGPVSIYALTCGPDGVCRDENT